MGIFNDMAIVDAFATNAYCIVSALFFSACAYAQLNDPNPIQWFCAYVIGGVLPNWIWMSDSSATRTICLGFDGFLAMLGIAIVYKVMVLAPKLLKDVENHYHGFVWAYLEHEEGRDSIGLLLLILHTSYLNSCLRRGPLAGRFGSNSNGNDRRKRLSGWWSPMTISIGLLAILGVCVYIWVVHHPDLVAKHGLKHCQGEMFGRAGEL